MDAGARVGAELGEMAAEVARLAERGDEGVRRRAEEFREALQALRVDMPGVGEFDDSLARIRELYAAVSGRRVAAPKKVVHGDERKGGDGSDEKDGGKGKGAGVEDEF